MNYSAFLIIHCIYPFKGLRALLDRNLIFDLICNVKGSARMDEKDHVLLADLTHFYLRPIYTFNNSTHIFDNEDSIREALNEYRMLDKGVEFKHYSFVDSHDSQLTQLSDIFVGFMGKYTNYRNTHTMKEIKAHIDSFSGLQLENMRLLLYYY